MLRERSIRGKSNHGSILRQPCGYYLNGTCTRSPCEYWHPPECQFYKTKTGCKLGDTCLFPHYKVDEQPNKRLKKGYFPTRRESEDKGALAIVKTRITIGFVYHKTRMHSLLKERKSFGETRCRTSIQRVRFTKSTLRHASIHDKKGPSLGKVQVKPRHQRSPHAVEFRIGPTEETERQERCAQRKAWDLAKNIYTLKANDKATFFSPTEEVSTPKRLSKRAGGERICG